MTEIACTKCGATDIPKYRRKRKKNPTGKRGSRLKTITIASYCVVCHSEDQKIREERRYEKKLEYNRIWRKNNRDKINKYNRKSYKKTTRSSWGGM
jgi:hypothetical protein